MKRAPRKKVDPYPHMMRGTTEFEEARIKCDFELVFKQVAELGLSSIKETHEFTYRKAFVAGKAAGLREKENQ